MSNEYVAACWGVACSVEAANAVERKWMLNGSESNYENGQTRDLVIAVHLLISGL